MKIRQELIEQIYRGDWETILEEKIRKKKKKRSKIARKICNPMALDIPAQATATSLDIIPPKEHLMSHLNLRIHTEV